jgi:hypothetical protein
MPHTVAGNHHPVAALHAPGCDGTGDTVAVGPFDRQAKGPARGIGSAHLVGDDARVIGATHQAPPPRAMVRGLVVNKLGCVVQADIGGPI